MNAFVTCIYNGLHHTPFGGRNNRDSRYLESLKVIARTGNKIFCFTSERDVHSIKNYLQLNNINNVELIIEELKNLPYHLLIQDIKTKKREHYSDIFWQHRCVELMWGKLWMMNSIITRHDIDNLYWIDAGLCHNDVISPKYDIPTEGVTVELFKRKPLFDNLFLDRLIDYSEDKILVIRQTNPNNKPIPDYFNANPYADHYGIIGGLFGGNTMKLLRVISAFDEKVNKILASEELYSEEGILAGIFADSPELFKDYQFDSWYHEGWPTMMDSSKINFSNFFDLITGIVPVEAPIKEKSTNGKVAFCTLAIGADYSVTCKRLIHSFLQMTESMVLMVVTDVPEKFIEFNNESRIILSQINYNHIPAFRYNLKYVAVERVFDLDVDINTIVFLDSDCYIKLPIVPETFSELRHGLNVFPNSIKLEDMLNNAIHLKIKMSSSDEELKNLNVFKESCLPFRIEDRSTFNQFIIEWKLIYDFIEANNLTHSAESIDISKAAQRAGYPLVKLENSGALQSAIYTTILDTETQALI